MKKKPRRRWDAHVPKVEVIPAHADDLIGFGTARGEVAVDYRVYWLHYAEGPRQALAVLDN